jgi:hypothetical protein
MKYGSVIVITLLAASCGGDDQATTDAGSGDSGADDAGSDSCYREAHDGDNATTAEATGLSRGLGPVAICGTIAHNHPSGGVLDVDGYQIAATVAGPVVVRITAPGSSALDRVDLDLAIGGDLLRVRVLGGVGIGVLSMPVGSHTLTVAARGQSPTDVPYQIEIVDDDPDLRCADLTGPLDYTEHDEASTGHRSNDMVAIETGPPLAASATPTTTDQAEQTVRAVSAVGRTILSGSSAAVGSAGDDYLDRDCYAVYTGQTTNVLEIRSAWTGTADLDVYVFESEQLDDPLGSPMAAVTGELVITAVKPSTLYWIWIGANRRSTSLPASYRIAMCGRELTPAGFAHHGVSR